MKAYKVKLEGIFLKINFGYGESLSGAIAVHVVVANDAPGAAARAKLLMLDQLEKRKIKKIDSGLLRSFGLVRGIWELKGCSDDWAGSDPGLVVYPINRLNIAPLLIEGLFYKLARPSFSFSF